MHYKTTFIKVSENPLFHSLFTTCVLKQSRFLKIQETYFFSVHHICATALPMSYTFGFFRPLQLFIHISCIPQDADTPCSWALDRKGCQTCFDAHGGDCHWCHWGSWCWGLGVHMGSGSSYGLAESLARSQWKLGWLKVSFPSFQRLKAVEIVQSFFWLYKYFVLQWYGSSAPV